MNYCPYKGILRITSFTCNDRLAANKILSCNGSILTADARKGFMRFEAFPFPVELKQPRSRFSELPDSNSDGGEHLILLLTE
jgi:hypothetical protein